MTDLVPSPCNNVCRIDQRSGWCEGCKRSVDEIIAWPTASDTEKQAILRALPGRSLTQQRWPS